MSARAAITGYAGAECDAETGHAAGVDPMRAAFEAAFEAIEASTPQGMIRAAVQEEIKDGTKYPGAVAGLTGYSPGYALVAYAGTGKDTLVADLRAGRLRTEDYAERARGARDRWVVYGPTDADGTIVPHAHQYQALAWLLDKENAGRVRRYAFADALKTQTHAWLGFPECPPLAFERVKNTLALPHPATGEIRTLRQFYIEHGQNGRAADPQCWTRRVAECIAADKREAGARGALLPLDITTDFRFDNELQPRPMGGANVVTLRLFRAEVPIAAPLPDRTIDSEHNLDKLRTTFLLLGPDTSLGAALEQFPQYAGYRPVCRILLVSL